MKYITVRAGMIRENPRVEFRGKVLYLKGFGDSMLNHDKLFRRLSDEGFCVISFDYRDKVAHKEK
jgi:alpha-beta hydrolase superfamily lysophospholipase